MAELNDKLDITVEELEEHLGAKKLPEFIHECERTFVSRTDAIVEEFCADRTKRAVFVSGPTSSGKTTFTMRLAAGLSAHGRKAEFLSLDDYYKMCALKFDRDGRPDFETIESLDIDRAAADVADLMAGKTVKPPRFNFVTREIEERDDSEAMMIPDDGVLVVEGLHGLSSTISGAASAEQSTKVFIMPYGNVFCDTKLMDSEEIRMLRRIVRDSRHRGASAVATVDYWPMIARSEESYYQDYLTRADIHVNSFLGYESLIIAPLALHDINESLDLMRQGKLPPSIFMQKSDRDRPYADLSAALDKCSRLVKHLQKIPVVDPAHVPAESILNEFISQ